MSVASLNFSDHVVAGEAHLELLEFGPSSALQQSIGYSHKLTAKERKKEKNKLQRINDNARGGHQRRKGAPLKFLNNADKILRKPPFVAQPLALARRAEMHDELDDLDDVVQCLFPHLAIKIDFLKKKKKKRSDHDRSHHCAPAQKKKKKTHLLDLDDLQKDARDSSHVGHFRGQTRSFLEHGDGHLKRPQLHVCLDGLEHHAPRKFRYVDICKEKRA
jgi:hypothetical protein